MNNKKPIYYFLGISFAFSWVMFLIPLIFKSNTTMYSSMASLLWAIGMWGPGLSAIIVTLFIVKEPFSALHLNRMGKFRYYLAAWFIPPMLSALAIVLSIVIGTAKFDPEFTTMKTMAQQSAQSGVALSTTALILIQLAQGLLIGPAINMVFTMGEELGWRGFLLPKMLPMGQWKALIWGGVIWGIWHAPTILQGHNYPEHPVLGVFLMTIFCILMSIIIGWMYLRTRSPWVAAVAHGSLNAWGGLSIVFLIPGFDYAFGGMLQSVTGFVILALFVGLLVFTKGLPVDEEPAAVTL